jgi:hypothetical protein
MPIEEEVIEQNLPEVKIWELFKNNFDLKHQI